MKKVITFGTFDTFHYGHLELLVRARSLGDYLIVAVSSDEFNLKKGKTSEFKLETRISWLKQIKCVDEIIIENSWTQKNDDIKKHQIDILVMGDDWSGTFDKVNCETVYLRRTPKISTTKIKGQINEQDEIKDLG